jgi:pyruvate formate lyase activating enzyme
MDLFHKKENKILECQVCPHYCRLAEGKTGICGVRKNSGSKIELVTYGFISGQALDPVEKKPLYHFFPGYKILSIGSWGCNMKCDFCQNYHISQNATVSGSRRTEPPELIEDAISGENNIGIAFTYNEPLIWYEYVRDVATLAKTAGLQTVMVTNGFTNEPVLKSCLGFIDAFNVDLKAFNNDFYRTISSADLEPVKKTLKIIAASGRHLEITTLIIPGLNDSISEMKSQVRWIADELGDEIPFHLSRYFPMYKRTTPATMQEALRNFYDIAREKLKYVYAGNIASDFGQDTSCPGCGATVTVRSGYQIKHLNCLDGKCSVCNREIYRNFTFSSFLR